MHNGLWTKTFTLNMFINFVLYVVFYLLTVIMGSVALNQYHVSAGIAGLMSGIFIVGGFAGRLWAGNKVSQVGQKKMLIIAVIYYLLTTICYFALRFIHGIGFGVAATASGTIVGSTVPIERRGEGIGYYALSLTLASATGPFLAILLYQTLGYFYILYSATILLLLAVFAALALQVEPIVVEKKLSDTSFKLSKLFERTALPITFIGLLVGFAYATIVTFLATYTAHLNLLLAGSVYYIIYAIFALISRPFTGRIFDRRGASAIMYPAFVLFALGLVLTGAATTTVTLLLAAALVGLGYGSFTPFGQTIAISNVTVDRIGAATSTFYGFMDVGVGIGPLILGLLIPVLGYRHIYYLAAGVMLAVIFVYFLLFRSKKLA
ncbi:permeases of the major facilitator superfamily [Weissella oryzae SG25]|uniref:Permeases of the major facilitator superfamily n=1 Tax=Weissella oryzae (strain DSM 25784 / JCM 18191 / LMG 30913 / SG25) TaxID=1329250 RepID=A0A069D0N5_WEIOS|nr:MFS transporter [Weissella oryzae]GAK30881.1 permeases of the major facilitator superfamily [Weissella oryzae SG25]